MVKQPKTAAERAASKVTKAARQLAQEFKSITASGYRLSDVNKTRTGRAKVHKGFRQK